MKKLGKILALMLAATLVLSLVACGGNSSGGKLTVFGNIGSSEGLSVLDEEIVNLFKEKTGIEVEVQTIASSGYMEQLQLMIVSGEYPDAALFPSTTVQAYINAVEEGIVVPLNEYLTEENAPNLMAYTYAEAWEGVKPLGDGQIMAIPRTSLIRNEGICVRADWLEKIGFGEVLDRDFHEVTADEFKEILKRMTFNDPDGNGKNDTYATSLWADDTTKQFGPIEQARGFYGDYGWYAYAGEEYEYMMPQYSKVSNIYKNQLQYTQDLYKAGYLDPDGPSLKKSDVNDRFNQGRYGLAPGFVGEMSGKEENLIDLYGGTKAERGNYVDYLFMEDANGYVAGNGYYKPMWGQWCVFESCSNPNNFVQLCDFLLSDEIWELVANGKEGLTYNMVDGVYTAVQTEAGARALGSQFPSGIVRKAGSRDYFAKTSTLQAKTAHMADVINNAFDIGQVTQVSGLDNGFTPSVATETKFINYSNTMIEKITKICANQLPVSEYDAVLDGWYAAGGQQYVEEMNEYIAKSQAENPTLKQPTAKADLVAQLQVQAEVE